MAAQKQQLGLHTRALRDAAINRAMRLREQREQRRVKQAWASSLVAEKLQEAGEFLRMYLLDQRFLRLNDLRGQRFINWILAS